MCRFVFLGLSPDKKVSVSTCIRTAIPRFLVGITGALRHGGGREEKVLRKRNNIRVHALDEEKNHSEIRLTSSREGRREEHKGKTTDAIQTLRTGLVRSNNELLYNLVAKVRPSTMEARIKYSFKLKKLVNPKPVI